MNNQEAKDYLGKALAKKMIRLSGTQKEIGDMLFVSAGTVGNIINGHYERLSIRMYMKLAKELQVKIEISVKDDIDG